MLAEEEGAGDGIELLDRAGTVGIVAVEEVMVVVVHRYTVKTRLWACFGICQSTGTLLYNRTEQREARLGLTTRMSIPDSVKAEPTGHPDIKDD